MAEAHSYLLVKRGLYYRPNNSGYTGFKERAGRYPESDADEASGVTAVHEDEADEIAPKCFDDLARDYLNEKLSTLRKENADLKAQGERQSSTIEIHHQNFDAIYERACRETGEFAEWVRSITHPEAEQR
ncbi:hypothetical protein [Sphingopyxis sp. FD7]|uniref:hypothetical protein n=1 Tax=Sphingopyxis sp. FD7 TaxID=1914525 RepID=UPI000DC6199B|nr:hypothetical protein [Sphingopyxis sp. FD7]BBB13615.1 hypothetical protein SPYCA_2873 [Sphingopyxis sp. FD7]